MLTRAAFLLAILVFISVAVTGCWDLKEPNQLSFVLGSGWDETDEGKIELSVLIPLARASGSGEGGSGGAGDKPYTVLSAVGKNIYDAAQHIQTKASRKLFSGHRIAVFISEPIAKQGIMQWLDVVIRDPDSNTRASLFVVKGISAKRLMENQNVMEQFTPLFAFRTVMSMGFKENTIYDLQREANNPEKCFFLPVVVSDSSSKDQQLQIQEIALFNKEHKMIGSLKDRDAFCAIWAAGKLSNTNLTHYVSNGKGAVSLDLHHLKRKVKVSIDGGQVRAKLSLSGKGIIRENNTNLNLLSPAVKESVAQEMKEKTEEEVRQVIEKVQKQYKTDIFGFGNQIGWKHSDQWKKLSENWEETFSNMQVSVEVNLTIQGVGQVGSGSKVNIKGLGL